MTRFLDLRSDDERERISEFEHARVGQTEEMLDAVMKELTSGRPPKDSLPGWVVLATDKSQGDQRFVYAVQMEISVDIRARVFVTVARLMKLGEVRYGQLSSAECIFSVCMEVPYDAIENGKNSTDCVTVTHREVHAPEDREQKAQTVERSYLRSLCDVAANADDADSSASVLVRGGGGGASGSDTWVRPGFSFGQYFERSEQIYGNNGGQKAGTEMVGETGEAHRKEGGNRLLDF